MAQRHIPGPRNAAALGRRSRPTGAGVAALALWWSAGGAALAGQVPQPQQAAVGVPRQAAVELPRQAAAVEPASPAMQALAAWVVARNDNAGLPYAIVDKLQARVIVFGPDGTALAGTAVLVGLAPGDRSVPGIGDRPLSGILPGERTTPAGRFEASLDFNAAGHRILWVDYADAISLHAVATGKPAERRLQRLATASPADNRISYGCINVPAAFFTGTVEPVFRARGGIVYVLPEIRTLAEVFGTPAPAKGAPAMGVSSMGVSSIGTP